MKIWLDDIRKAPAGWEYILWPAGVIELLKKGDVTHLSLDHDLGDDERGTGYDVLLWIEQAAMLDGFNPPCILCAFGQRVGEAESAGGHLQNKAY